MSGTGIFTFAQNFAAALVADPTIAAFCAEKFGRPMAAQIGQSAEANPKPDDCPITIITLGSRGTSDDGHMRARSIRMGVNIVADGKLTTVSTGVKIISGLVILDELMDLIEKFIVSYSQTSGIGIASTPQGGPEDVIDNEILKAWLALGVQLDSEYRT